MRLPLLLLNIIFIYRIHASPACDSILLSPLDKSLNINSATQSVVWGFSEITFSPSQFRALSLILQNAPKLVSSDEIADVVWDSSGATKEDIRTLIVRIKRKFLKIDPSFDLIRNRYGRGYYWSHGEESQKTFGAFILYQDRGIVQCRDKILELSPWEADFLSTLSSEPLSPHPYRSFTKTSESGRTALITFRSKVSKLNTRFKTHFNLTQNIIKSKQNGYYMLNLETEAYSY